jgi:hypothetical protein
MKNHVWFILKEHASEAVGVTNADKLRNDGHLREPSPHLRIEDIGVVFGIVRQNEQRGSKLRDLAHELGTDRSARPCYENDFSFDQARHGADIAGVFGSAEQVGNFDWARPDGGVGIDNLRRREV